MELFPISLVWSDVDPEVQDVAITTILDYVHRDVLKAPMVEIEGS